MPRGLNKSIVRELPGGELRSFSSFPDFVVWLVESEQIATEDELFSARPDLLDSILFEWYRQGQIACVFARVLAMDPLANKWTSVVVGGEPDPEVLQPLLETASQECEALQLIFPGDGSPQQVVELINSLCAHPAWTWEEIDWKGGEPPSSLLVGLRWHAPGGSYVSWVLGIAPFETMPFTRRFVGAPMIVIAFRPSRPTPFAPPDDVAHLAHMNDGFGSQDDRRQRSKSHTRKAKLALIGEEPLSVARAKVTFALPEVCRTQLVTSTPSGLI